MRGCKTSVGFLNGLWLTFCITNDSDVTSEAYFDTNLIVHALLLLFYLLLQLLDRGAIRSGSVGLEDLDILICEWCNLLLLDLVVGKLLLVLLPVLSCGGRLGQLASYQLPPT
jgi:hypothetical protein